MKPLMTSAITFGLVSIPIKVLSATESHDIAFRQIHTSDGCGGRIRYRKICELDGQVLTNQEIGRGYELPSGDLVEITDADLDGMPLPTAKVIEIVAFVPAASIDPIRLGTASYWLAADGPVAAKPYVLIERALQRNAKVAIVKFALRDRERLGLLRVKDGCLLMHAMRWDDEIRSPAALAPKAKVKLSDAELCEAQALVDAFGDIDLAEVRDNYRDALEAVITGKAEGRLAEPDDALDAAPAGQVVDLMAMLHASVAKAQESRGEAEATVHDMKPKAKTAAKKKTAKKATPKKNTPTAKTPARKPRESA